MSESASTPPEPVPAPNLPPPPPAPAPAPPPASVRVIEAPTDRENELAAELEAEQARHARTAEEKKDHELRIMQLEDELRALKQVTPAAPAAPKVRRGPLGVAIYEDE
jgi:hypothetical protein